jgi:L-lactate dehydrogenase complex protein LldG
MLRRDPAAMSSSRDQILARLNQVKRAPVVPTALVRATAAELFADLPPAGDDLAKTFADRLTTLRGNCVIVEDLRAAAIAVEHELSYAEPGSVLLQSDALLERVAGFSSRLRALISGDGAGVSNEELARKTVGITRADRLIARSGSIVLRSNHAGGRRLSVLPEHHLVIASEAELVPSFGGWLLEIEKDKSWNYSVIISGPSRTSDIEKILVLGAHGPRRLSVVIVRDPG